MDAAMAKQMLTGPSTLDFLKTCVVAINGRGTAPENDYYIYKETRAAADKSDVFRIIHHLPQSVTVRAHTVPMVNRSTLTGLGAIAATPLPYTGASLMVTGMLTACTFLYTPDKKNMFCAHIEPTRAPGVQNVGLKLGTDLVNGGGFSNTTVKPLAFTHREYSSAHHANVLGVRRLDGWSIYVQIVDTDNGILAALQII